MEKAMNEFGDLCLSYRRNGSPIREIVTWFNEEIKVLPATIAKANKNLPAMLSSVFS
jgi:hypothetical protein